MALIRTPKMAKNPLEDMPSFYNPMAAQSPQAEPPKWQTATATPGPTTNAGTNDDLWARYERDYHAPDRADVLANIRQYGTDDRTQWGPTPTVPDPKLPGPKVPTWQQPPTVGAPGGFDQTKWANTNWNTDKYKAGRILAAGGGVQDVLAALGQGWRQVNADAIMAPDGSVFDLYKDYGGPGQEVQWTYVGGGPSAGMAPPVPPKAGQAAAPVPTQAPAAAANSTPNFAAQASPSPMPQTAPSLLQPGGQSQSGGAVQIPWQPGKLGWQADPTSQATFAQVSAALSRALGRTPTAEEVWAHLNYDQRPDANFLRAIVNNIAQNVKPDPQAPAQAPAAQEDPYVAAYQQYLEQYLQMLAAQRAEMEARNVGLRERQGQAQASTDRLLKYLEERAAKLQGPAYTGAEAEVFRTQALDPIEADRTAAKQRALQRISSRGLDPNSGIAQQLLNDVDAAFDQSRATTQNELAYSQITEQRSREQEAQQLLGMVPSIQRAAMQGDVEFLDYLDQQIRNTYQQGMGANQAKYNIPNDALQQALAALGVGPDPMQLMQMLLQQQTYQQGNSNALWGSLGSMLPYLLSMFGGSNPYQEIHGSGGY